MQPVFRCCFQINFSSSANPYSDFKFIYRLHVRASLRSIYSEYLCFCAGLLSSFSWGYTDPTKVFWIIEMLKGYGKLSSRADTRLPITLPIFVTFWRRHQPYALVYIEHALIFTAMCTTAFFAFLRVGELTFCPRSADVLQLNQVVQLVESSGHITGLKITFANFKRSYNQNKNIAVIH